MMPSQRLIAFILPLTLAFSLSACGSFGGKDAEFVEQGETERDIDVRTGPDTKELLKSLPSGLIGDKAHTRHTYETLKGEEPSDNN